MLQSNGVLKSLVGKHKWFKFDVATDRKPVEGAKQWGGVGELGFG